MAFVPKRSGWGQGIDFFLDPPGALIAVMVKLTVVKIAERHGELVTYFTAKCARLGKCQMMGMARLTVANEAGFGGDKADMVLIAQPLRFSQMQFAFVN
jgi:hypothetical protein